MSAYRQDYLTANAPRQRLQDPFENRIGQAIAVTLVAIVAVAAAAAHLIAPEAPAAQPVHSPVVVHYQLPPMDVEDARVEGFRAGFAAAIEQACSAPALSQPIAAR